VPAKEVKEQSCEKCGSTMENMLRPLIREGKLVAKLPPAKEIRDYVLRQLEKVEGI